MNSEYRILIKENREIKGGTCIPMTIPACFREDKSNFFIGEINNFKNLVFNKRLNNYGTCRFDILVDDTEANALISLCEYQVYIYKVTSTGDVLVWSGEQRRRTGDLKENHNDWCTIYCYDWLYALKDRYTAKSVIYNGVQEESSPLLGTISTISVSGGHPWIENTDLGRLVYIPSGSTLAITDYIKSNNFGFDIPSNAIIKGVKVRIKTFQDGSENKDTEVKLVIGGTIQSTNRGNDSDVFDDSFPYVVYGGIDDLWGYELTPDIINSPDFGIAFSYTCNPNNVFVAVDVTLCPEITVYYVIGNVVDISDAGAIAWDLIKTSQLKTNGNLGITEGNIATTQDRTRTYNNQNIMEAIVNLSEVINGFDFEITNDKVFNVYTIKGDDLTDSLILEYGRNLQSVSIDEDFTTPCNNAIVLGEVIDGTELTRVDRPDTTTQAKYKLREMVLSADNVIDADTLNEKGDAMLYKYKEPLIKITFEVIRGMIDVTQFSLGDLIRLIIKKGCYNIDSTYRIFEWTVDHENDNTEKLSLILGELGI